MGLPIDKNRLIEAIQNTDDERILFAINRLLQIEEAVPQWHVAILEERLQALKKGESHFTEWQRLKTSLFNDIE